MFCRIGISEKGAATVKLSVSMVPGHSSMPPSETSIGILAAAIKRWEERNVWRTLFSLCIQAVECVWLHATVNYYDSMDKKPKCNTLTIPCHFLRLEDNPMPRLFGYGPERGIFEHLAHKVRETNNLWQCPSMLDLSLLLLILWPQFRLPLKFIMSNLWLFSPLLGR